VAGGNCEELRDALIEGWSYSTVGRIIWKRGRIACGNWIETSKSDGTDNAAIRDDPIFELQRIPESRGGLTI
jgi:hypothetical protein